MEEPNAPCAIGEESGRSSVHQTDGLACREAGADTNNRPHDSFVNHSGPSAKVTLEFDGHEPGETYFDKSGLAAGSLVDSSDVVQGRMVDNSNLCVLVERGPRILLCVVYTSLCSVRFFLDSRRMPFFDVIKSDGPSRQTLGQNLTTWPIGL